jgi:putative hydrolase of the HAD superfamily
MHPFVKAVAFDFGQTLVEEGAVFENPRLMSGVREVLPKIGLPLAVWANTRSSGRDDVQAVLKTLSIDHYFSSVVTSVEAGFRKPSPQFFDFAVNQCGFRREQILFVGNQLNTDVLGAESYGIRTAWLCGEAFRSRDETMTLDEVKPSFVLQDLPELLPLLKLVGMRTG